MDATQLCFDTSALIAFLKNRQPGADAVEKAIRDYTCCVTAITVYELMFGVRRAQRDIGEDALLGLMSVLPFDDAAARCCAEIHAALVSRNQDIGIKDVLIGSICLQNNVPLLTLNEQHFTRIPRFDGPHSFRDSCALI